MPKLIITEKNNKKERIHECVEDSIIIGRLPGNTIPLLNPEVSRKHAQIIKENENFFLMDLESGNGTKLNATQIPAKEKVLLRNNDLISIERYNLRFLLTDEILEQSYNEEVTDSDILEVKLLKKVLKSLDKETVPSFEVLNGSAEGKKVFLTDEVNELIFGRDPECDFPINEFAISRKHAKISKRWGGIVIRDLESKNGTFVNNRRIVEEFLHDGDRIALGTIVLMFRNPQEINIDQLTEKFQPKNKPTNTPLNEIPLSENSKDLPEPELDEEQKDIESPEPVKHNIKYPVRPTQKGFLSRLTPAEIGMLGLGGLIFIFALITLVNLLFE